MENKMEISKEFTQKFITDTFNLQDTNNRNFVRSFYFWCTDSKLRTTKRLDKFLAEQLINPDPELVKIANLFAKTEDSDERIIAILKFVNKNVRYEKDVYAYEKNEYWQSASDTWKNKVDDCEGINGLIYVLARLSGISQLQLWSCLGDTSSGYHYYNLYFSFKRDKWFVIDGTYHVDLSPIKDRNMFILNKFYQSVDYIFNEDYIFT